MLKPEGQRKGYGAKKERTGDSFQINMMHKIILTERGKGDRKGEKVSLQ